MSHCILITGGIRSGKSRFAQDMAEKAGGKVLFVATAEARDEEMKERIAKHRKERPVGWRTIELTSGVATILKQGLRDSSTVLLDCLDMLISNILDKYASRGDTHELNYQEIGKQIDDEVAGLEKYIRESAATYIIVSNEVGMGLVSLNKLGRYYQDFLGLTNQRLAEFSNEVYFMVSGIPIKIK